ncbi:MAG: GspH/FimT family pseudopilin [Wenzhouxiangella sp.]
MREQNKGLTVIELMIAVAVMAVILTTAMPALGRFMENQRINAATNELVGHLQYARHEAIFRNTYVAACPSRDGRTCTGGNRWDQGWIVHVDANNSRQPDRPEDILRVVEGDENTLMHSAGRTRVRFQGHGGAYGTNLTIRVCDRDGSAAPRAVIVSNPGRVRTTRDVDPGECEV